MGLSKIYPYVDSIVDPHLTARGRFKDDKPTGITIHYSADRNKQRMYNSLHDRKLGYHLVIDRNGKVDQMCWLNQRCDHAGPSLWNGKSCNQNHLAICIVSWGLVTLAPDGNYLTWSKEKLPHEDIELRPGNINKEMQYWDAATSVQEDILLRILRMTDIDPKDICGHDEAAIPPGRKVDPGGVLSRTMPEIRKLLTLS